MLVVGMQFPAEAGQPVCCTAMSPASFGAPPDCVMRTLIPFNSSGYPVEDGTPRIGFVAFNAIPLTVRRRYLVGQAGTALLLSLAGLSLLRRQGQV